MTLSHTLHTDASVLEQHFTAGDTLNYFLYSEVVTNVGVDSGLLSVVSDDEWVFFL